MILVQNLTTNAVKVVAQGGEYWVQLGSQVWFDGRTGSVEVAGTTYGVGDAAVAFAKTQVAIGGVYTSSLDWLWLVPMTFVFTWMLWKFIYRMCSWVGGHFGPGPLD